MTAYIVCEGKANVEILNAILPPELLQDVTIATSRTRYDTEALARSLVIRRQKPVAVVLTGEVKDVVVVQEQCRSMQRSLESVAINAPMKAIFLAPNEDLADVRELPMVQELVQFLQLVHDDRKVVPTMDEVA
jgi:hypothetical protein